MFGTTTVVGSHAKAADNYDYYGWIDEVAVWRRALSDAEVLNIYLRGSIRVKYQIRACADAACSANPPFVGPAGSASAYFSELLNLSPDLPAIGVWGAISASRYAQYRIYLETDNAMYTPIATSVRRHKAP